MKRHGKIFKALFALYVCAVLFLCFGHFESMPEIGKTLLGIPTDKVAHFLMFLPLPVLGYLAFSKEYGKGDGLVKTITWISVLGCIFAALTEAGQMLISFREGDLMDYFADFLGILTGALCLHAIIYRQRIQSR